MKTAHKCHRCSNPQTHLIGFDVASAHFSSKHVSSYMMFFPPKCDARHERCKTEHNNSFQLWIFISETSSNSSSSEHLTMAITSSEIWKMFQPNIRNTNTTFTHAVTYFSGHSSLFFCSAQRLVWSVFIRKTANIQPIKIQHDAFASIPTKNKIG